MWLVACFSPLCTCVFPPALAISCSIFFAAFNGLISMFIRAYYLADTWNPSNILVERFTRVPNQIHLSKPRHCAREEVKQWLVVDLPGSSFQCFISWRTFKVYLQFKKETSWRIDYRLINNSEQLQSLQKTVRYSKHRQNNRYPTKNDSEMPNFYDA